MATERDGREKRVKTLSSSHDSHVTYHMMSLGLHALLVAHRRVDFSQCLLVSANSLFPSATQVLGAESSLTRGHPLIRVTS